MNAIKFFFTLVLFFTFAVLSQAQVADNHPQNEESTVLELNIQYDVDQLEGEILVDTYNTDKNITKTATVTAPAGSNISPITVEAYVFNFNHKQFLKPVVKKSALC